MTLNPKLNPNPKSKIKSLKPKKREDKINMTHRCAVTIFHINYFSAKIAKKQMLARTPQPLGGKPRREVRQIEEKK